MTVITSTSVGFMSMAYRLLFIAGKNTLLMVLSMLKKCFEAEYLLYQAVALLTLPVVMPPIYFHTFRATYVDAACGDASSFSVAQAHHGHP